MAAADGVIKYSLAELKRKGGSVVEVRVKVGRFMFADLEELYSAWGLLVLDTPLKDAKLTVESVDGRGCSVSEVVFG